MEKKFTGNWPTMITPFLESGKIDYQGVEQIVQWYIDHQMDGIFGVCQSSEMFYLSIEEREALGRAVLRAADGRIPVIFSGHISTDIEVQLKELERMAGLGAQAIVLVTNRMDSKEGNGETWFKNTRRILEAFPEVTFGLYECPYPYKRVLSPEELAWCAKSGRFVFLKDTCCDLNLIAAKLKAVQGTKLKIFNANTVTLLESLQMGCVGYSGVMLNFYPDLFHELIKCWETDFQKAERYQNFASVSALIELQLYPVNAKYHMQLQGLDIGLTTRAVSEKQLLPHMKMEVEHLYRLWKQLKAEESKRSYKTSERAKDKVLAI